MNYQSPTRMRREALTLAGRFRSGKLVPVMAVPVRPNEGGLVSQSITLELDPIMGRMITPISAEFTAVFVPVQAIDAILDPLAAYAGMTEVIREKFLSGNPLFGLEGETEISKRCGVNPVSIAGVKQVCSITRLAHNAAVNHLRLKKYNKATKIAHGNTGVTPALLSSTILERLNGVLDPDDRINGAVELQMPNMELPVNGITYHDGTSAAAGNYTESDSGAVRTGAINMKPAFVFTNEVNGTDFPKVVAELNGQVAGNVSLSDFYAAEKMDRLTRVMRRIADENPEYGEEMVLRWAFGLSVDAGRLPFVVGQQSRIFGRDIVDAMDSAGVEAETIRSDMDLALSLTFPVPRTELGGMIITFATVKPDETISSMPHPILSDVWGADNMVADEMAVDPVPVTFRNLDSACPAPQESTIAMYTGLNSLKQSYIHYGFNRLVDPTTVESKTSVWQLNLPMSLTPDNILYPDILEQYPFADQLAEICRYTITSVATIKTPMQFGPTPVEQLAIIGAENIFEE